MKPSALRAMSPTATSGRAWFNISHLHWRKVELDSEAGMFAANGDRASLEQLRELMAPYLDDGPGIAATIRQAEGSGFQFDD